MGTEIFEDANKLKKERSRGTRPQGEGKARRGRDRVSRVLYSRGKCSFSPSKSQRKKEGGEGGSGRRPPCSEGAEKLCPHSW